MSATLAVIKIVKYIFVQKAYLALINRAKSVCVGES